MSRSRWCGVTLLAAGILLTAAEAEGQVVDRVRFGAGFIVNAPNQMVGGGGYVLFPSFGGIGLYFDVKGDLDSPSKDRAFDKTLTAAEVVADPRYSGTRFLKKETSWKRSYNVALVRPLNPFIMVYGGAGYSQGEKYALYDVPQGDVGRALWVRDPALDQDQLNLLGGLILRMVPSISTHVGFETQPGGFTAGASLRIPSW